MQEEGGAGARGAAFLAAAKGQAMVLPLKLSSLRADTNGMVRKFLHSAHDFRGFVDGLGMGAAELERDGAWQLRSMVDVAAKSLTAQADGAKVASEQLEAYAALCDRVCASASGVGEEHPLLSASEALLASISEPAWPLLALSWSEQGAFSAVESCGAAEPPPP